jgi:hypothetical protein
MNASNPAYRRAFSTQQHNSTEYFRTRHVNPELLALIGSDLPPAEDGTPKLPPALKFRGQQIGRAMSRASQAAKRVQEIERYILSTDAILRAFGQTIPDLPQPIVRAHDKALEHLACALEHLQRPGARGFWLLLGSSK